MSDIVCPYCQRRHEEGHVDEYTVKGRLLYGCLTCDKFWYADYHMELLEKNKKSFRERITDWLKLGKR